jgi:hypothetical protein
MVGHERVDMEGTATRIGDDDTITTLRPAAWCSSKSSSASANTMGEITSSRVSA